jgi:hypothetical protein
MKRWDFKHARCVSQARGRLVAKSCRCDDLATAVCLKR